MRKKILLFYSNSYFTQNSIVKLFNVKNIIIIYEYFPCNFTLKRKLISNLSKAVKFLSTVNKMFQLSYIQ